MSAVAALVMRYLPLPCEGSHYLSRASRSYLQESEHKGWQKSCALKLLFRLIIS